MTDSAHELSSHAPVELTVPDEFAGHRLDAFLSESFPRYSRAQMRRAIGAKGVLVDGRLVKAAYRLKEGQRVHIVLPQREPEGPQPEDIPLDVLYEDEHLAVINKPPGMVVHPAKGHWSGTLTSALAHHFQQLSSAGGPTRPGVVHRLDRDTSGVIVVAKTDRAHYGLTAQFEARTPVKEYFALVAGKAELDRDVIEQPIGPHPYHREKMAIRTGCRQAKTFYEVVERFDGFAALRVLPHTGRTHQIRIHLAHAGMPVLADRLYGGRARLTRGELSGDRGDLAVLLDRQALHALRLSLVHPLHDTPLSIEAPLPRDVQAVLEALRRHRRFDQ